jgi:predicted MFS family arabinose efflux permease
MYLIGIYALAGAVIMFSVLLVIGINQPRKMSVMIWCVFYVVIAVTFDVLVIVALLYQYAVLIELILGVSAGAATGLAIHVTHHVFEERNKTKT